MMRMEWPVGWERMWLVAESWAFSFAAYRISGSSGMWFVVNWGHEEEN